ncbi:MAG: aspartate--tRNA(Asn) ligase [Candidatus Daviesbacteria bacterium]|nr:aspartate--tRNA(Asn) ligase [Candidatus Daviesbacteria bacterium]
MSRTLIIDCNNKVGEKVTICGFVQTRRDHGKIVFLDILDRSGLIQVVAMGDMALGLNSQDVVCIEGTVSNRPEHMINKNLSTGEIEFQAEKIEILSKAEDLPFDMGVKDLDLQLPTLLDFRSLTLRFPKVKDIFRVQAALLDGFRNAAKKLDCVEIIVPTISAGSTEGGAEVFKVDYYGHKGFLTQSPQLYKQMMVPVYERVFTIAKAYRAEPSVTTYHLSESTQMDCEFGFVKFEDLLNYLETVAVEMINESAKNCESILKEFDVPMPKFGKIPRLTLREAQEVIYKETGRDVRQEKDLARQDEVDICVWALKEHGSDLVTITHFPTKKRAFYTKPDPANPEFSLSYDILFRGLEICSGSQRINDCQELKDAIIERGMDPKNFELYLQAFKYGMPPEGGFSFGLERITMHLLNLANVREASLFPRDMERVDVRLSTLK